MRSVLVHGAAGSVLGVTLTVAGCRAPLARLMSNVPGAAVIIWGRAVGKTTLALVLLVWAGSVHCSRPSSVKSRARQLGGQSRFQGRCQPGCHLPAEDSGAAEQDPRLRFAHHLGQCLDAELDGLLQAGTVHQHQPVYAGIPELARQARGDPGPDEHGDELLAQLIGQPLSFAGQLQGDVSQLPFAVLCQYPDPFVL